MGYSLQQLSDLEEIRALKHRYFRAIDTGDMPLLASVLAEDVAVDYRGGGYRARVQGKAEMVEFIANAFPASALAMHHGHMPDIGFTGPDSAEGIWYLEDVFIDLARDTRTDGTALYRDQYRRIEGAWKIARTEYDRVIEIVYPRDKTGEITAHMLSRTGRKPEAVKDISHYLEWYEPGQD
jgi:hypothetical protein